MRKTNITRLVIFLLVALLHGGLILFFVIQLEPVDLTVEQPVMVMKLTDIAEDTPPPPPPPPPKEPPPPQPMNAVESIAETMIETDEVPEEQVVVDPGTLVVSEAPPAPVRAAEPEREEYLPMHKISISPVFDERDILRALVYPPIALRAGIQGTVYLELFIDSKGLVQQITVLKENPPDKGFGEAAKAAFKGLRCTPAKANDRPVAVRYRYPVRFALKG